jgi:hypothetical protein
VAQPVIGTAFAARPTLAPGENVTVVLTWSTKGMDVYRYVLSEWQGSVLPHLHAEVTVDTDRFALYRDGLPHTRTRAGAGSVVSFDLANFSSSQDLGVSFLDERAAVDTVRTAIVASPGAVAAFLVIVFLWSQLRRVRFPGFHYLFVAAVPVFFFLFLTFLVRYLSVASALGIGTVVMLVMFAVCFPAIFGLRFATRVALPYLLALTFGYTLLFQLPVFRGVGLTAFAFAICVSIMIPVARADVSKWPCVAGWDEP